MGRSDFRFKVLTPPPGIPCCLQMVSDSLRKALTRPPPVFLVVCRW
jgi:hypothetical protein